MEDKTSRSVLQEMTGKISNINAFVALRYLSGHDTVFAIPTRYAMHYPENYYDEFFYILYADLTAFSNIEYKSIYSIRISKYSNSISSAVEKSHKNYPRSKVWSFLHLLVTEFEIGCLQTLAFGGSVSLT